MLSLVVASRVWIIMDSRVACEFIRSTEALCATRELAGVRLLAGVSANVSGLMLQTMECAVAQGTFVRSRKILTGLLVRRTRSLHQGGQQAYRGGHVRVRLFS